MRHINLFSIPISITPLSGALAIITRWVIEWKSTRGTKGIKSTKGKFPGEEIPIMQPSDTSGTSGTSGTFPKIVTTPNPEMIVAAQKDPEFLKALQSADLAIPDGWGTVIAVRLLNSKLKTQNSKLERISGIEFMEALVQKATADGWRVMLVGGKEGVAEKATEKLRAKVSRVAQVPQGKEKQLDSPAFGTFGTSGTFGAFSLHALSAPPDITHASPHDLDHLITSINKIKPDLLFVAFGHGKQEKWMVANRDRLAVGVMMGVGGALDQIVNPTLRPPPTIDRIGLGWLYRLLREPWRWRRQLALVKFTAMVFRVFVRSI